jgi:hypothetical protein
MQSLTKGISTLTGEFVLLKRSATKNKQKSCFYDSKALSKVGFGLSNAD